MDFSNIDMGLTFGLAAAGAATGVAGKLAAEMTSAAFGIAQVIGGDRNGPPRVASLISYVASGALLGAMVGAGGSAVYNELTAERPAQVSTAGAAPQPVR